MSELINKKEFSDLIRDFAGYKANNQGRSKKTVDEYLLDIRTFFRFLVAREQDIMFNSEAFFHLDISHIGLSELEKIRPTDIYDFLDYTVDIRDNKASARSRKISSLRALYKYICNVCHYLTYNPMSDIESPKQKKALPKFLTLEESILLLQTIENDVESPNRIRDYCIITLFLNCGMRVSELAGIKLTDMDPDLLSLRVIGKGNKERIVYLNEACRNALAIYLDEVRGLPKYQSLSTKALFLSKFSQPISVKTIQAMVYKYLNMAGLGARHLSVHKLRHTAATLMYQTGHVDVRVLKEILGHEQLNTTQIYTHVGDGAIASAMEQNPLAKISKKEDL